LSVELVVVRREEEVHLPFDVIAWLDAVVFELAEKSTITIFTYFFSRFEGSVF
jgi:hypothetical protein